MPMLFKKLRVTSFLAFLAFFFIPQAAFAVLNSAFNDTGQYTLAVDGGGSQNATNYQITIEKPAGATVHRAYAIVTGVPGQTPGTGALSFDFGAGNITPNLGVLENSGGSFPANSRYDDVTADLSASLDAAAAGDVIITVTENASTGAFDGSALLVVWNDPNAPLTTVGIDLGAVTTGTAPTITYTVAAPFQTNQQGFEALIGLGISFSTGDGGQVSAFTFEGTPVTATAGGFEDGARANGALWTIGGQGDTPDRTDNDELYEVSDLIANGTTDITTNFVGGTQDDYLTVQWIQIRNPYGMTIVEPVDNSFAQTEPNYSGDAPINVTVDLTWTDSGGNTVATASVMSDANGDWTAPQQGLGDGTYLLTATATNASGTFTDSATFTIDTVAPVLTLDTPVDGTATTDTTPTISGTTDANQEVVVTITDSGGNVVEVLTPIADMNGDWTVDPAALADGAYTVSATATDAAGNVTSAGPNNFAVDTTAPALTLDEPANVSITNDNTPTVAGTSEPGLTVTVDLQDVNGNSLGMFTATADVNGDWSLDLPQQSDGGYQVVATVTDAAGNTSAAGPNVFSIDTMPPPVQITSPVDGTVSNNSSPTLSGQTEPFQVVTFTVTDSQGNVVDTFTGPADMNGEFLFALQFLGEDTYTITVEATDSVGNTGSDSVTYTLDFTPPAVAITTPADGSSTNDTTPTIGGTAEVGAMIVVTVVDDGGNTVDTLMATADMNGDWSVDVTTPLPEGAYAATATATDAAGNSAMTTPTAFIVDTTAPALTFDTPADGTVSNDTTPTLSGTVEVGAPVVVRVLDDQGNEVQVLATNELAGTWDATALMLADGTYTFEATATDAAGNSTTVTNTYTVDTAPPTLTFDSPADGSTNNDNTPALSGTVEDGSSVVVRVLDDQGNEVQVLATNVLNGAWDATALMLADGTYTFEATATDAAGNTTVVTNTVTIDTAPPAVALVTPIDGNSINDTTPTVSGTAEAGATITATITDSNGNVVETLMATADANGDWSVDATTMLPEGDYSVSVTATDSAGNTAMGGPNNFTVDTTAPALAITTPADMGAVNDDTPTVSGTTEAGSVVTIEITDSNGNVVETLMATADANGDWTADVTATLAEGDYVAQASTTDVAGNSSSAMSGFTVDVTEPGISITAPTDGEVFGTRQVDVTGTSEAGADISVNLVDAQGMVLETQTATADMNGDWSVSFQGIANGDYAAEATASDAATNTSTETVTFTIDSDEPNLTVTSPAADAVLADATPDVAGTSDGDATITIIITDDAGNEVANFTATPDANGDWSASPDQDLPEGDYTVSVTATRPNGKSTTVDRAITVDVTAPALTIASPTDGLITNQSTVTVAGTSDADQVVQVTVTDSAGAEVFSGDVTADANGDWSVDVTGLTDGDYSVEASAQDEAGNEATAGPVGFTVNTGAPTITITSPAAGDEVVDPTPTISGTAEPGAVIEIFVDGEKVDEVTAGEDGTWSYEVTEELATGEHTVEARTTNDAGTEGSSGEITFTIAEEEGAPLVITSPAEGEEVEGPDVTISGTGEPGTEVTVTVGGEEQTVTVDEDGNWSVTVEGVADGETTIEASAGDQSVTVTVTVTDGSGGGDDASDIYVLTGGHGDCGASSAGANNTPVSLGWLLLVMICVGWRRRRQR